ncbi:hypothetical protein C488_08372 [Natrinema pellirubrum DSM 15624]|uniref:Right handed beta helix domain-containing protein n=1 Tax=Natrinema pellirubrum (strain DSM 15624 / CIP 106293 / JCM 10476 / NCIMB 786 / 157) TaxID=797303 RepID=L9YQ69_NATP1|nr:hypothetical protein [Natrinema pellirubrum]ELY76274.1 hypothetical protein C488_08372 [Natrinema pellirubrum DSM 15624]
MNQTVVLHTDELRGDWDTLVSTGSGLVNALVNASQGEIIQCASKSITISNWLDLDVDDVVVRGVDGQTTITVADGANVGGFRIGSNSATTGVTVKDFHFDGNYDGQDQTVKRLHAYITEDCDDIEFVRCSATRTSPYQEHNSGGSGFAARSLSTNIRYVDCSTDDIGDRAWQLAGSGHELIRPKTRDGYDRSVSLDIQLPDGSWDGADDVTITDADLGGMADGSAIKTVQYGASNIRIVDPHIHGGIKGGIEAHNSNCSDWTIIAPEIDKQTATGADSALYLCEDAIVIGGDIKQTSTSGGGGIVIDVQGPNVEISDLDVNIESGGGTNQLTRVEGNHFSWRGEILNADHITVALTLQHRIACHRIRLIPSTWRLYSFQFACNPMNFVSHGFCSRAKP